MFQNRTNPIPRTLVRYQNRASRELNQVRALLLILPVLLLLCEILSFKTGQIRSEDSRAISVMNAPSVGRTLCAPGTILYPNTPSPSALSHYNSRSLVHNIINLFYLYTPKKGLYNIKTISV